MLLGLYLTCLLAAPPAAPLTTKQWFELGNQHFSAKQYSAASHAFLQAVLACPTNLPALSNLAASRCKEGRFQDAVQHAQAMVRLSPGFAKARYRMAQALHGLGRKREALLFSTQAWKLDPNEPMYAAFRNALQDLFSSSKQDLADITQQALQELRASLIGGGGGKEEEGSNHTPMLLPNRRVPVTVLSGFLGSGKTTLLKRILESTAEELGGMRVAVLVNDMGEINIDAQLLANPTTTTPIVELTNGCICCTLRDDLVREVMALAANLDVDYICVESTGISEPMPVALAFSGAHEDVVSGRSLAQCTRLDCMVTVVDASHFVQVFRSSTRLGEVGLQSTQQDKRTLSQLLMDQVEFADVIVINKIDLLLPQQGGIGLDAVQLERLVQEMNPTAKIVLATHCEQVQIMGTVLNSRLFSFERASQDVRFRQELLFPHEPETQEYGISSFAFQRSSASLGFRSRRIFDLLMDAQRLEKEFGVWRAKGFLYVREDNRVVLRYAKAGPNVQLDAAGLWNKGNNNTRGGGGDPKIELVFIGVGLRREELERELAFAMDDGDGDEGGFDPTAAGLGEAMYHHVMKPVYDKVLAGPEQQFKRQGAVTKAERLEQLRERLTLLANMERDMTDEEQSEGAAMAQEYRRLIKGGTS